MLLLPVLLVGAKIRVSGRRVKGLPEGTARWAALDAAAASWTLGAEEDGPVRYRPACRVRLADLKAQNTGDGDDDDGAAGALAPVG